MKLYIIRHGETSWNVQRRLQGTSDTDLNENGITLAKRTGEALKEIPFDLCFTSPLKRAKMTAELILAGRDIPIYDDERLREISFGEWEGRDSALLPAHMLDNFFHHTEVYEPPKGGESIREICTRTKDFFQELIYREKLQDKTLLIASHGCAVRALLQNVYADAEIRNFWHGCVPPNCGVNIVEVADGRAELLEEDIVFG